MFGEGRGTGSQDPSDGTWYCDCRLDPPRPTICWKVKKKTLNKGRWFHKCLDGAVQDGGCGFFRFCDKLTSARNFRFGVIPEDEDETTTTPATTTAAPSTPTRRDVPHLPDTPDASPSTTSRKRTRLAVDDDAYDGGQKAARTERRAFKEEPFPTIFSTPGSSMMAKGGPSRSWKEPVTPASSFETFGTPTPSWYRDAGLGLTSDDGLVGHISALLLRDRGVTLDDQTKKALGRLLRRSNRAKDAKMTEAAHHITTLEAELKVKDAKITECLHRITTLEAELEDAELTEPEDGI